MTILCAKVKRMKGLEFDVIVGAMIGFSLVAPRSVAERLGLGA